MSSASELLDLFVSTFNEGQWEANSALSAPGAVFEEVGTGKTFNVEESEQNARAWKSAFPDAHGVIENRIVSGNQAAGEIIWSGTNTGSFNGMPPTGKRVKVRAVVTIVEEGGKMVRNRHYIDVAGMLTQLGLLPQPAGS